MSAELSAPLALVADDDPVARRLLAMVLARQGFRVLSAPDGATALELLSVEAPSVVFVDAHMPHPDGYELCREIRHRRREDKGPIVIMVTAAGQDSDRSRAIAAGVDDFITKPFSPSKLAVRLRELQREL